MNLQVRLLPPQNLSSESSYVPQSQAVQATFVISVAPDETFGSLLEKVRKRNEGGLVRGRVERGKIIGLQNVERKDLDLSEEVGRVFAADSGRDERIVLAVQTHMPDSKGKRKRDEQEGEEHGGDVGKRRKVDGASVAARVQSTRDGIVESISKDGRDKLATDERSRHIRHSLTREASREQILVPDSQDSLPTPRSDSYTSEAPTSAQREVVTRVPASGQSPGLRATRPSRRLLQEPSMEEDDPIEDDETDQRDRSLEALQQSAMLRDKKTQHKPFEDLNANTTPAARTVTRPRMKAVSKSGQKSSPRTPMSTNGKWTAAEDALLLKSLQDKLSVREALQEYNICKTVTAARSRRLLLQREFPDGLPVPLPEPLRNRVVPTSLPSKSQSHAGSQTGGLDDTNVLQAAITAGYDTAEIRAMYFPNETQTAVDAKFARALPDVVSSECEKEDWPQDDVQTTGWGGEHNLKLRRCLHEKLSVRDAYKRYFSEWNIRLVRRKYTAYRKQILGDDVDQTELEDRSLVQSSARKRDTFGSKLSTRTSGRKKKGSAGGVLNDVTTLQSASRYKTMSADDEAEAAAPSPQSTIKALQARRGQMSIEDAQARPDRQQSRTDSEDRYAEPAVKVTAGRFGNQEANNAKKKAASTGRRKALDLLRTKKVLEPDVAYDQGTDAKQKSAEDSSTSSAEVIIADTEIEANHGSDYPDGVQPTPPETQATTDVLPMDVENTFQIYDVQGRDEEAGNVEVFASTSDSGSADTSVWQQQASAQLQGSTSVSPEPSDVPQSPQKDLETFSQQPATPLRGRSTHSALRPHNTVRPFFNVRHDSRPSSQLEQELEFSSANAVANMLQGDTDSNAPDLASPASSFDDSVSGHSDVPLEKPEILEGSPEFMTQVSASSRSQQLKKYGSRSPRTAALVHALPRAPRPQVAKRPMQEAHHATNYNSAPNEEAQSSAEFHGFQPVPQPTTKGKLRRISNKNTHMSDALKRRSIAEDIQSNSETAITLGSPQHKPEDHVLPSPKQDVSTDSRPPEVMSIRPQSKSSASLPAKSFRDIETTVARPQSSDDWMDHGLPSMNGHYSAGHSNSSKESSPLIDGDLKTAMELAANPKGIRAVVKPPTPEINQIGLAEALRPTRQASTESAEKDISRNVRDASDEEDLSDDADSDFAGVDYASSTSEEVEVVIHERELMNVDSEDEEVAEADSDYDEQTDDRSESAQNLVAKVSREKLDPVESRSSSIVQPNSSQGTDHEKQHIKASKDHGLKGPPLQRGEREVSEARTASSDPNVQAKAAREATVVSADDPRTHTSDEELSDDITNDSAETSDEDATSSSDSDSEIDPGEVSDTKALDEAQKDDPDMLSREAAPRSLDYNTIAAEIKQNSDSGFDRSSAAPNIASRDVSLGGGSLPPEPEVVALSNDSRSSDEDSDESESQDSDDESVSDEIEQLGEALESPKRRLSAAGSLTKVIDEVEGKGGDSSEERSEESSASSEETDSDDSKDSRRSLNESKVTAPRKRKDENIAPSPPSLVVRKAEHIPDSRNEPAQVNRERPPVSARASGNAALASTAPVTIGNRVNTRPSLRDNLPQSSPATKVTGTLQNQRFRLSNLLGKATSIPASSPYVQKGQPVKRYLPPTDDEDEDSDSDSSSSG